MANLTNLKIGNLLYWSSCRWGYSVRKITGETKKYWLCDVNEVANIKIRKLDGYVEKYVYATIFEGEIKERVEFKEWITKALNFEFDRDKLIKENKEEIDTFIKKYGKEVKR